MKLNLYFTDLYVVTGKYTRCALPACQAERVNGHCTGGKMGGHIITRDYVQISEMQIELHR